MCRDDVSVEACHIRTAALGYGKFHTGLGEKPSDKWAVPLCGRCHREQHAFGDELKWWHSKGIDPFMTGGDLFGLIVAPHNHGVLFVDDNDNTLKLWGR